MPTPDRRVAGGTGSALLHWKLSPGALRTAQNSTPNPGLLTQAGQAAPGDSAFFPWKSLPWRLRLLQAGLRPPLGAARLTGPGLAPPLPHSPSHLQALLQNRPSPPAADQEAREPRIPCQPLLVQPRASVESNRPGSLRCKPSFLLFSINPGPAPELRADGDLTQPGTLRQQPVQKQK